jgi:beta-glucuronidase
MSEFGGDAKAGLHGGDNDRWTEEYQANIYRHQLGMLNRIPQLRGMSPWILMDFRSPNRPWQAFRMSSIARDLSLTRAEEGGLFVLQKAYKEGTVGKPE